MARRKGIGAQKGLNPRTRGGSGGRLVWLEDSITPNLERIGPYVNDIVATTMRYYEGPVESYARSNAPWTDQTANARNGLIAQSGRTKDTAFLVLAHRVDYGVYLELAMDRRFAIIASTLEKFAPEIMGRIEGILDKFNGRATLVR